MMNYRKLLSLTAALGLLSFGSAEAAHVVVDGEGATRQLATRDAFRAAVEHQLGVLVDAKTLVSSSQLIADQVVAHSDGFVAGYTVLSTTTTAGVTHVKVDVDVVDSLKATVTDVLANRRLVDVNLGSPRVALVVVDAVGRPLPLDAFVDVVHQAGFDRVVVGGDGDLLYTGHVASEAVGACTSPGFENWYTSRSTITARLVSGNEVINTWTTTGVGFDISRQGALELGRRKALAELATNLTTQLRTTAAQVGQRVTVLMHGFTAGEAQRVLTETSGTQQVFVRSVDRGLVVLDANVDCSPAELAVALEPSYVVTLADRTLTVSKR